MLLAHSRALNAKLDAFLGSEQARYPWCIEGMGMCNIVGKSLTKISLIRNDDFSDVRYTDEIHQGVSWKCISNTDDVKAFFKDTPPKLKELASLYTTGGGSAALCMEVTVGKKRLRFREEKENSGCCIQ
jgi:hypothetical protein